MHPDVEAQRVRAMLEAYRAFEKAKEAAYAARHSYVNAQKALTGAFPSSHRPGPYICGDVYIEATGENEEGVCFDYTKATRVTTSD